MREHASAPESHHPVSVGVFSRKVSRVQMGTWSLHYATDVRTRKCTESSVAFRSFRHACVGVLQPEKLRTFALLFHQLEGIAIQKRSGGQLVTTRSSTKSKSNQITVNVGFCIAIILPVARSATAETTTEGILCPSSFPATDRRWGKSRCKRFRIT